jgi:hypothetical protein
MDTDGERATSKLFMYSKLQQTSFHRHELEALVVS